ncbi:hypothetical protein DASC09_022920 [Saccharomycopsis crataegensis]|uniref:Uncharacterized protein n=1 Tax=Saccharomycopsis crataegensis TaxID=43959 RepID=A0AAV5QK33_9ASCO|nr:hypothetical protein DASC09_022920 [Saccharomycopsis crataegensis]
MDRFSATPILIIHTSDKLVDFINENHPALYGSVTYNRRLFKTVNQDVEVARLDNLYTLTNNGLFAAIDSVVRYMGLISAGVIWHVHVQQPQMLQRDPQVRQLIEVKKFIETVFPKYFGSSLINFNSITANEVAARLPSMCNICKNICAVLDETLVSMLSRYKLAGIFKDLSLLLRDAHWKMKDNQFFVRIDDDIIRLLDIFSFYSQMDKIFCIYINEVVCQFLENFRDGSPVVDEAVEGMQCFLLLYQLDDSTLLKNKDILGYSIDHCRIAASIVIMCESITNLTTLIWVSLFDDLRPFFKNTLGGKELQEIEDSFLKSQTDFVNFRAAFQNHQAKFVKEISGKMKKHYGKFISSVKDYETITKKIQNLIDRTEKFGDKIPRTNDLDFVKVSDCLHRIGILLQAMVKEEKLSQDTYRSLYLITHNLHFLVQGIMGNDLLFWQ